jgi:putative flippase GtrA
MKKLLEKYHDILIYLLCSILTALIEMAIGWNLLKILPDIVITNTIAILISSIIHYLITLKLVFRQKNTMGNVIIYVATFVFGILLQDFIIALFYNYIFVDAGEFIRYAISKILSLGIPFLVIYLLRSFLYKKYNSNGEGVEK